MTTRRHDTPATRLPPTRVLLVEDNSAFAANVGEYLEESGWAVDYARDGPAALRLAETALFDVVVLDLALPRLDGLDVCARLRASGRNRRLPVLMMTARDALDDKLSGFAAGADDYLTKPFALAELKVRIEALLRRLARDSVLHVGPLRFDTETCEVTRGERALRPSPLGLRLLELLMRRSPSVVGRAEIEFSLWGDAPPEGDSALRVHIHALRRVVDAPGEESLLHTVAGVGYALRHG